MNGVSGKHPVVINARVGVDVPLDAAGTRDPDGHALRYRWFFYPEAGSGIPGQPVAIRERTPAAGAGGIPPAPEDGPPQPPPRVIFRDSEGTARPTEVQSKLAVSVVPKVQGVAHVILAVEDDGSPSLTSYRRIIFRIGP